MTQVCTFFIGSSFSGIDLGLSGLWRVRDWWLTSSIFTNMEVIPADSGTGHYIEWSLG